MMGDIRDKHKKRKDRDSDPLSGGLGDRKQNKDFDIDSENIKDKQQKE